MTRTVKRGSIKLEENVTPPSALELKIGKITLAVNEPIVADPKAFEKKVKAGFRAFAIAHDRGLRPTPYFFEAIDYVRKAKILQAASLENGGLGAEKVPKVGDPLMETIPIYNTVQRRYAGFSNVLEQLWYGSRAPKVQANKARGFYDPKLKAWKGISKILPREWLYLCLAHRITGSGASFEWDHGWRNNRIYEIAYLDKMSEMSHRLSTYDGPIFTSIGNQIPPFPKCGGREYLDYLAPQLVLKTYKWLSWRATQSGPAPIKQVVDKVLEFHTELGCKQFKFVLTAWVMDIAEYMPHLVDPNSDCYHGKNAIEAVDICFYNTTMTRQQKLDAATRLFADVSGTQPMDVEDASPGCDLVRWIENYVPKKGFDHVHENEIFNGSSLTWSHGRQPPPF